MAPSASLPLSRGRREGTVTGTRQDGLNGLEKICPRGKDAEVIALSANGYRRVGGELTYRNTTKTGRGGANLPEERLNTSMRDLCKRVFLLEMMAGAREAVAMGIPAWASKGI